MEEKEDKGHHRISRWYIGRRVGVVCTLREASSKQAPLDETTILFVDVPDELKQSSEVNSVG
jgi:hypothetical protein